MSNFKLVPPLPSGTHNGEGSCVSWWPSCTRGKRGQRQKWALQPQPEIRQRGAGFYIPWIPSKSMRIAQRHLDPRLRQLHPSQSLWLMTTKLWQSLHRGNFGTQLIVIQNSRSYHQAIVKTTVSCHVALISFNKINVNINKL